MRDHLPPGGEEPFERMIWALMRQQDTPPRWRGKRDDGERDEAGTPADQVGEELVTTSRLLKPPRLEADGTDFGGGGGSPPAIVADIGDGDGRSRQHQPCTRATR